jgi:hypothetical protein
MADLAGQKITELSRACNETPIPGRTSPAYEETSRQLERYTAIQKLIQNHPYDRVGVYKYLQREMAGES